MCSNMPAVVENLGPVGSIKNLKLKSTTSGDVYEREVTITNSNVQTLQAGVCVR